MAADRGRFICQSQSLNIHLKNPTPQLLTKVHFYGWKRPKTGSYYIVQNPLRMLKTLLLTIRWNKKLKRRNRKKKNV